MKENYANLFGFYGNKIFLNVLKATLLWILIRKLKHKLQRVILILPLDFIMTISNYGRAEINVTPT